MKKRNILLTILGVLLMTSCNGLIQFGSQSSKNSSSQSKQTSGHSSLVEDKDGYRRLQINNTIQELDYVYGALPSLGKPKALVIPVEFPDCTAESKKYSIDKIETAFNGNSQDVEWESVNSFFKKSSYGKVDVDFDVMTSWFKTKNSIKSSPT